MIARRLLMAAAASGDWWLSGGVSASNAKAVYQPIGAASLAASYNDLSGNGNDATPGVAPTWASSTGWTFNGSSQYLLTPISSLFSGNDTPATIIARCTPSASGNKFILAIGSSSVTNPIFGAGLLATSKLRIFKRDDTGANTTASSTTSYTTSDQVFGWRHNGTTVDFFFGGSPDNNVVQNVGTLTVNTTAIGALIYAGSPSGSSFYNGDIAAMAVYNTALSNAAIAAVSTAAAALTG